MCICKGCLAIGQQAAALCNNNNKKVTYLCDNAMQFNGKTLHYTQACTHPWMESENSYSLLFIMNCYAVCFHLKKGQKHEFITQTGLSGA